MAISSNRVREIRKQLEDAARDLEGDESYTELADLVAAASDGFSAMVDERGQMTEAPAPQVGARVKRDEEPGDMADPDVEPDDVDVDEADDPRKPKRKLPPQFRR